MKIIYTFNDKQVHELHMLYQQEWWTESRTIDDTKKCIDGSQLCIGLIDNSGTLQGFVRVLTDYVFKALIFDLIVTKEQRDSGIGSKLISIVKEHPTLQDVNHLELYCLPEVFKFYEKHGFSSDVGNIKLMRCKNA
jgi:ribosomal protein S18 acetylase RimI-like enzyme